MGSASEKEDEDFRQVKREIEDYAQTQGLQAKVSSRDRAPRPRDPHAHRRRALRLRPGDASARGPRRCSTRSPACCGPRCAHPIVVEGYTDRSPSTASSPRTGSSPPRALDLGRAYLIRRDVAPGRLAASATAPAPGRHQRHRRGRMRNRRVELVLIRTSPGPRKGPLTMKRLLSSRSSCPRPARLVGGRQDLRVRQAGRPSPSPRSTATSTCCPRSSSSTSPTTASRSSTSALVLHHALPRRGRRPGAAMARRPTPPEGFGPLPAGGRGARRRHRRVTDVTRDSS